MPNSGLNQFSWNKFFISFHTGQISNLLFSCYFSSSLNCTCNFACVIILVFNHTTIFTILLLHYACPAEIEKDLAISHASILFVPVVDAGGVLVLLGEGVPPDGQVPGPAAVASDVGHRDVRLVRPGEAKVTKVNFESLQQFECSRTNSLIRHNFHKLHFTFISFDY